MAQEYPLVVRKGNTGRLTVVYEDPDGNPIPTNGCVGTLYVYDGAVIVVEKVATNDAVNGEFDIFLDILDIESFNFRRGVYEFTVEFPNGDITTLVDGPLIVESGRGPFE